MTEERDREEVVAELKAWATVVFQGFSISSVIINKIAEILYEDPNHPVHKVLAIRRGDGALKPSMSSTKDGYKVNMQKNGCVSLYGNFSPEEKAKLVEVHKGMVELAFYPGKTNEHKMAAACSKIDHHLVMSSMRSADRVIDIGGNVVYHAKHDRNVHCCNPLLTPRDHGRRTTRVMSLMAMNSAYQRVWFGDSHRGVVADPTKVMCNCRVGECTAQANVMVMFHVYDIHVRELGDDMVRHGADYLMGSIMMPADRVWREEGVIPLINARYKREGNVIRFGFKNDSSLTYSHDRDILESYTRDTIITAADGTQFIYQICQVRPHGIIFRVTRAYGKISEQYHHMKTTTRYVDDACMRIKTYKYNPFASEHRRLVPKIAECPTVTFNLTLSKALLLPEGLFTKREVDAHLRAYNVGFTSNARKMLGGRKVSPEDIGSIGLVIYLIAFRMRQTNYDVNNLFIEQQNDIRDFSRSGILERVSKTVKKWWNGQVRGVFTPVSEFLNDVEQMWLRDEDIDAVLTDALATVDTSLLVSACVAPPEWKNQDRMPDCDFQAMLKMAAEDLDWDGAFDEILLENKYAEKEKNKVDDSERGGNMSDDSNSVDGSETGISDGSGVYDVMEDDKDVESSRRSVVESDQMHVDVNDHGDFVSTVHAELPFEESAKVRPYSQEFEDMPDDNGERAYGNGPGDPDDDSVSIETSWTANFTEQRSIEMDQSALGEYIAYLKAEMQGKQGNAMNACEHILQGGVINEQVLRGWRYNAAPNIYKLVLGAVPGVRGMMYKQLPVSDSYMIGYDFARERFVTSVAHKRRGVVVATTWPDDVDSLFVCEDFETWLYEAQIAAYERILSYAYIHNLGMPKETVFYAGVPGAKKSKQLQDLCRISMRAGNSVAVIVKSRSARATLARHMTHPEYGIMTQAEVRDLVRTSDSFLLNYQSDYEGPGKQWRQVDEFYVDEALMDHYGGVVAKAIMSGAKRVFMFGDPKQICFVKRIRFDLMYDNLFNPLDCYRMNVSARLSPCMVAAISSIYNGAVYSDRVDDDFILPEFIPISGIDEIPREEETLYICPYKDDRKKLLQCGFKYVVTPEQCQGDTVRDVIMIQLSPTQKNMFNHEQFMNVAFSRATYSFRFCSVDRDSMNLARRMIDDGRNVNLIERAKYNRNIHGMKVCKIEGVSLQNIY